MRRMNRALYFNLLFYPRFQLLICVCVLNRVISLLDLRPFRAIHVLETLCVCCLYFKQV